MFVHAVNQPPLVFPVPATNISKKIRECVLLLLLPHSAGSTGGIYITIYNLVAVQVAEINSKIRIRFPPFFSKDFSFLKHEKDVGRLAALPIPPLRRLASLCGNRDESQVS